MGISARREPDQGQPEEDSDHGQQSGSDDVPKQPPNVGVSGLNAQGPLPADDIDTMSA
jgi:hypothetical protein